MATTSPGLLHSLTTLRWIAVAGQALAVLLAVHVFGLRLPALPADWVEVSRQYRFELRQSHQVLWQGHELPREVPVTLNGRAYTLAAGVANGRVQIQLAERVASK